MAADRFESPTRLAGGARHAAGRHGWIYRWLFGVAVIVTVSVLAAKLEEGLSFVDLLRRAHPAWLGLAAVLQLATYAADARSWQRVLCRAGEARPLGPFLSLGLAKLFVDQALPSGGISGTLVVVRGLERRGVPRAKSVASVVVDLYAYYAAYVVALAAALAVLYGRGELGAPIVVTAAAFGAMALSVVALLTALTTSLGRRLPMRLLRLRAVAPLVAAVAGADAPMVRRPALLATSFGYQLVIFALDAATMWTVLRAVGTPTYAPPVFASFMVSSLARSLGVLPGGIGTFEAASVATLHMVGVPLVAALAATLIFRGLTFWLPLVPGVLLARREMR